MYSLHMEHSGDWGWDITQVLSMSLFVALYEKKRVPAVERLCSVWTGRNCCGLTVPGENKASCCGAGCRWSSVAWLPLQTRQSIESRWSFKKCYACCNTTSNLFFQSTDLNVYVYLVSPKYSKSQRIVAYKMAKQ